jgi:cobalamin biosynthesis Mg chelatase CobN
MTTLRTGFGLLAAIIVGFALPTAAGAEYLVPPGNSAANQYTESFPTAGGDQKAEKGRSGGDRSPAEVLGSRNTGRLDAQGAAGREAAAAVAATAPSASVTASRDTAGGGTNSEAGAPTQGGGSAVDGGGSDSAADQPSGSSGLSEVIAEATGSSSSGQMGPLLPLLILTTVVGSLAYLWRRRGAPAA